MDKNENYDFSVLHVDYVKYKTLLTRKFQNRKFYKDPEIDKIHSFISGTIKEVLVKKGSKVNEGDEILILDAMKMNNIIRSSVNGKVKKIHVKAEQKVAKGDLLVEFTLDQ